MISNIRSTVLCSLALLAASANANPGYEKQQQSQPAYPQPQLTNTYITVTYTPPPVTVTTCCKGTITQETTTVITGPTYIEGTQVTHQIDYFTYWIQGNVTISSVTSASIESSFISNPIPHVGPQTAVAPTGIRALNSLPSPCTTILNTVTLSFDPVKQTAVYYRDRVETEFTLPVPTTATTTTTVAPVIIVPTTTTTTTTTTETTTPTVQPINQIPDGQVQNQAPPASNETIAAPAEAVAGAPTERVSKFALGLFIGGAIIAIV